MPCDAGCRYVGSFDCDSDSLCGRPAIVLPLFETRGSSHCVRRRSPSATIDDYDLMKGLLLQVQKTEL